MNDSFFYIGNSIKSFNQKYQRDFSSMPTMLNKLLKDRYQRRENRPYSIYRKRSCRHNDY